jgi:hypothetical protein
MYPNRAAYRNAAFGAAREALEPGSAELAAFNPGGLALANDQVMFHSTPHKRSGVEQIDRVTLAPVRGFAPVRSQLAEYWARLIRSVRQRG